MKSDTRTILQISVNLKFGDNVLEEHIIAAAKSESVRLVSVFMQNPHQQEYQGKSDKVYNLGLQKQQAKGMRRKAVLRAIADICTIENPDTVICHRFKPITLGLQLNKKFNFRKCILVNHGLGYYDRFSRRMQVKHALRKNCTMVGVSETVSEYVRSKGMPCLTIDNAIDVDGCYRGLLSKEEAKGQLGLETDDFVFGCIARVTENKNHATLISAFVKSNAARHGAKLVIIGDGDFRPKLQEMIDASHVQGQIILTGTIIDAKRFLRALDVFVFPSLKEGLPLAVIEAMTAEIPIIASEIDPVTSILGGISKQFPATDSSALAALLDEYFEMGEEQRRSIGALLHQRAKAQYDIGRFKSEYLQIITDADQ